MKIFEEFILENKNDVRIINVIQTIIKTSLEIKFNNKVTDFRFDFNKQYKKINVSFDFNHLPENFDADSSKALITLQKIEYVKNEIKSLEEFFSERYKKGLNDFYVTDNNNHLYVYIQLDGNDILYGHKDNASLSNEIKSFLAINKYNL